MHRSDSKVTMHTLPSGLRVVHRLCRGAAVDYCGVTVHVGSRDDDPDAPGMAHFLEHTIFKGTAKRSSWHIINRMERVGGELNAYTTKEETVVYTAAPAGNLSRALELIADLVLNSRFPDTELDKEREVVADEINSYLDSPADAVFDDFEDLAFAGTPIGHNILGNVEALARFDSVSCREYLRHWYTAGNMVVFYCGAVSAERVIAAVERLFACLPVHDCAHARLPKGFSPAPFDVSRSIDSHQAHTVMGCVIPGMYSPDRFALSLLNNILGGPGMNSLLNVALREKHGYVYSVETAMSLMTDTGLFTVYFGCDPSDTDKCKALVRREIGRLAESPMSARALAQAKKQYIGQMAVASDNRENLAISTARGCMYHNNVLSAAESASLINAVTPADITRLATTLLSLSSLTLTN